MPSVIRDLESRSDYDQCVRLQRATWGEHFLELVPPALLTVAQKVGGLCIGAFDESTLVGFVFGLTGLKDGEPVHWSHMLAVRDDHRDRGIGKSLKQRQRERLEAMGVRTVFWTFDPLVSRNAHLNLHRLGARAIAYVPDMYGNDPMSTTDEVIGSDRLVVEWSLGALDSGTSQATAAGIETELAPSRLWSPTEPSETCSLPPTGSVSVSIPGDIQQLKRDSPDTAHRWRQATRRVFQHYLQRNYVIAGFERADEGGGAYLLEPHG